MVERIFKTTLLLLCFIKSISIAAQNEGNIWYFGTYAGIDFNSGSAVALSNSAMLTEEGCSAICDISGELLFYTNGEVVYNRNHEIMPNGTALLGHVSSTQSAIIVKKPESQTLYYIFTLDAQGWANGLRYSVVDMTLQGGLGDVNSLKNVPVYSPVCEKIIAIKHSNDTDFWIVIHDFPGDSFRSYLLNSAGLDPNPVTTNIGSFVQNDILSPANALGYLKANSEGDKIAVAHQGLNTTNVIDFDNSTGMLSNSISIPGSLPYGIEFSPNDQYLYISTWGLPAIYVKQYDLLAGLPNDIINSEVTIATSDTIVFGALQLAPDEKIYIAEHPHSNTLSAISNPNMPGVNSNFTLNSFSLDVSSSSQYGLPTFYNSYLSGNNPRINICRGDSVTLHSENFQNHNWALANTPSIVISNDSLITISPAADTDYIVYDGADTSFFFVRIQELPIVNLGPDIEICSGSGIDTLLNMNTLSAGHAFLWQDGSTNDSLIITSTGDYWLEVTSSLSCVGSDTITISNRNDVVTITHGNPICHNDSNGSIVVNTTDTIAGFSFEIKNNLGVTLNGTGTNLANGLSSGIFFIEYSGPNCTGRDSITLINPPLINFNISTINPPCHGDRSGSGFISNISGFQGELDSVQYNWTPNPQSNNGLLTDSIWNLGAGEYALEVVDKFGCTNSLIFNITEPNPLIGIISDSLSSMCRTSDNQNGRGLLSAYTSANASGVGNVSYNWQHMDNGQSANTSTFNDIKAPGNIVLTITDANGCEFLDTIYLDSINPIAEFDIESDQFDFLDIYEGTEDVKIKITNLSTGYIQENDPNADVIFQWNLYANQYPDSYKNWFFTYDLDDKVDTTYEGEQIYEVCLITKNYNDCADTTCKQVTVHSIPLLVAPNVFTPGRMPNNEFFFPSEGIEEFECTVFNRYGIKVFEFNDISDKWDGNHFLNGKPCSDAVYFYIYTAKSTNGKSFSGEGQLSLLRNKH